MKPHYHSAKAVFITILTCAALLTSCSDNDSETAPENSSTSPEYHYSHVPLKTRQNIKKVFPNKRLVSTEVLESNILYKTFLVYDGIFKSSYPYNRDYACMSYTECIWTNNDIEKTNHWTEDLEYVPIPFIVRVNQLQLLYIMKSQISPA